MGFTPVHGSAEWILRGDYRGRDGSSCCGPRDCFRIPLEQLWLKGDRFEFLFGERTWTWPWAEAKPSEDNQPWVCFYLDYRGRPVEPRCFFRPKSDV